MLLDASTAAAAFIVSLIVILHLVSLEVGGMMSPFSHSFILCAIFKVRSDCLSKGHSNVAGHPICAVSLCA